MFRTAPLLLAALLALPATAFADGTGDAGQKVFAGIKDADKRKALIAYLKSLHD